MRYIARGYATSEPRDTHVLAQLNITAEARETHDGLDRALWWEFEEQPSRWERLVNATACLIPDRPTRASRNIGALIVVVGILAAMGLAGAVEGHAAPNRHYTYSWLLKREWKVWVALDDPATYDYYCSLEPAVAEAVWIDGMRESDAWDAPHRMQKRVAHHVIERGCGR